METKILQCDGHEVDNLWIRILDNFASAYLWPKFRTEVEKEGPHPWQFVVGPGEWDVKKWRMDTTDPVTCCFRFCCWNLVADSSLYSKWGSRQIDALALTHELW